jgi:hypothetical protein
MTKVIASERLAQSLWGDCPIASQTIVCISNVLWSHVIWRKRTEINNDHVHLNETLW